MSCMRINGKADFQSMAIVINVPASHASHVRVKLNGIAAPASRRVY